MANQQRQRTVFWTVLKRILCDLSGLKNIPFVKNQTCSEARQDLRAASSDAGSDGVRAITLCVVSILLQLNTMRLSNGSDGGALGYYYGAWYNW